MTDTTTSTNPAASSDSAAERPAVSVMVATRDRPELLRKTLAAIAAQDYAGQVEAVVIFDRSEPDESLASDDVRRPVTVISNVRRPGLQGARNSGIEASTNPLVGFCDDDDVWRTDKLSRQVDALDADPDVDMVTCGLEIVFEERRLRRVSETERITRADLLRSRAIDATHPSSFLFRRTMLAEVGLIDEDVPGGYGEDYDWILRVSNHSDIVTVAEPMVDILWHESSFYAERWQMRIDGLEYLLAQHPDFASEPIGLARIKGQIAFAEAAMGNRRRAWSAIRETLRLDRTEKRAYLAAAMTTGLVSADTIVRAVQRRGRSI